MFASDQNQTTESVLALAGDAPEGVVVVGPDGTIEFANPTAVDLIGLDPHVISGNPFTDIFGPEDRGRAVGCLSRSRLGQEALEVLPMGGGAEDGRHVEIRARGLDDGRTLVVLGDIGALRRHAHALQIVSAALAEAKSSDFFEALVLALVEALPNDFAFVGELLEPERTHVRLHAFAGPDGLLEAASYPIDGTPCDVAMTRRRSFFTDDAPTDFPRDRMLIDMGVRSYYAVPLLDGSRKAVGILGILNHASVPLDSLVASMLDLVAGRAQSELLRLRMERQSERADRLMRALMEASSRFIWGVDANGSPTLEGAGAWREVTGLDSSRTGTTSWISAVIAEDRDRTWAEWRSALAEERDLDMTYRVDGPRGIRHLHVRGIPIHDEAGSFEGFIGTIDDVTELNRLNEDLRRRNDVLRVLRAVPEATHNGAGFLESIQVALSEICRTSPFHVGRLLMQGSDGGPFEHTGLVCGERSPGEPLGSHPRVTRLLENDPGLPARVTSARSPVWMRIDCPEDEAEDRDEAEAGWTVAYVTIRFDDEPAAILELIARRCLDPDETWTEILAQVGLQLGRAYERDRNQLLMREAERQARESQKLEAVGRLSGGIAHDFNNLLMVILGEAELALRAEGLTGPLRSALEEIRASGQRAASLTGQLLAFSRRQIESPEKIELAGLIRDAERMFRRLLGEDVELDTSRATEGGELFVEIPRGLMEQVVMNLLINAREAMPTGGRIGIGLERRQVSPERAAAILTAEPGDYVVLSVTDTGTGIPQDIRDSIFEPFFTTKDDGTGFGLSTSYGIVSSAGGFIEVDSVVGEGSEFRIFLPLVDGAETTAKPTEPEASKVPQGRSVLIVEDDDGVRSVAIRILESAGYTVHAARDAREVLSYLEEDGSPPDVLLTDCVLERETGRDIDALVRERHPDVGTVFMSGYTDDVLLRQGVKADGREFLPKPFSPDALVEAVERVHSDGRRQSPEPSPSPR